MPLRSTAAALACTACPEPLPLARHECPQLSTSAVRTLSGAHGLHGCPQTLERSYLLRMNGRVAERPQHMLMRVSVGIHRADIDLAVQTYHLLSERWFTHASPTLFNAGTPRPQLSSCFLVCMKNDSIEVRPAGRAAARYVCTAGGRLSARPCRCFQAGRKVWSQQNRPGVHCRACVLRCPTQRHPYSWRRTTGADSASNPMHRHFHVQTPPVCCQRMRLAAIMTGLCTALRPLSGAACQQLHRRHCTGVPQHTGSELHKNRSRQAGLLLGGCHRQPLLPVCSCSGGAAQPAGRCSCATVRQAAHEGPVPASSLAGPSTGHDCAQGIYDTLKECACISKSAGGIGLSIHNIRSVGSYIRGTNGNSNGIVPMIRVFNDTARCLFLPATCCLIAGELHGSGWRRHAAGPPRAQRHACVLGLRSCRGLECHMRAGLSAHKTWQSAPWWRKQKTRLVRRNAGQRVAPEAPASTQPEHACMAPGCRRSRRCRTPPARTSVQALLRTHVHAAAQPQHGQRSWSATA